MDFQSPIIASSEIRRSRISDTRHEFRRGNLDRTSFLADQSIMDHTNFRGTTARPRDSLSQTVFDDDPTFTSINRPRQFGDETRFNFTAISRTAFKDDDETANPLLDINILGVNQAWNLLNDFLQGFKSFNAEYQIFNQIANYECKCGEHVKSLQKLIRSTPRGHDKLLQSVNLEHHLRLEKDTWKLIASLYQDRLNSEFQDMDEDAWLNPEDETSEKELVLQLYEKNSAIRQAQLVVDWLEQRAADMYHETQYNQVEFFGNVTVGWENTLRVLLSKSKGLPTDGEDRSLITEMDPDAPHRQQDKCLHPLDKEDEIRLLMSVFARLRCGQLEEAQQLCFCAGQPYRAAMLEGWKLFHDPNMKSTSKTSTVKEPTAGNTYRDLWKSIAWKECDNSDLLAEERAILAVLCGRLDSLIPKCENWEDFLWAYLRSMIDRTVEKELRRCVKYKRQLEPMPDEYWNQQLTIEDIFTALAASKNKRVVTEGRDHYRTIQRYIIMDDIDGLLEEMVSWVSKKDTIIDSSVDVHLLRFMTHLVLFFRRIGRGSCDDLTGVIIEAYVNQLVEFSRIDLVATYTAQLPPDDQVRLYADCLAYIENQSEACSNEERSRLLSLAGEAGLDINAIAKRVVRILCHQSDAQLVGDASLQVPTSSEDERRIQALGWLLVDSSMRKCLLMEANSLMRGFLLRRQIEAVKSTFNLIPVDTISLLNEEWESRTGLTRLPTDIESAVREYICIKTYVDAVDAFQEWFTRFHLGKPKPPTVNQRDVGRQSTQLTFTENLVKEQHNKQHQAELQRWKIAVGSLTESAIDKLYNVLLFPDGGWLVDCNESEDSSRSHQLQLLRQTCIPHSMLLLCSILCSTGQYKRCLELADVIAAEPQALCRVCSAEQLAQLMSHLRQAYVKVLDLGTEL